MSLNVVGVDLGSVYCRLAQITPQRKMPVILRNTLSNESTPCIVSYPEDGSRLYGEAALGKDLSRPQQTSTVLKLALNVNASDADAVNALRLTGAPVSVVDNHVVYNLGDKELAPAQVVGYFLRNVLTFATAAPDLVCLAAPVASSAQYRNGLLDAAIVAGVPPHKVQVVDEADALAAYLHHLQYSDLPAAVEDAVRVLVLNCGESNTSVTLLSASQPKIDILASASIDVGVSVVDTVLADSVIAAIQKKHGEDMRTHPKSYNKIVRECKKAKVMLSTTEKVTVQFECLKSDIDHTMSFTVADLEAATSKYATAVAKLIESTANTAAVSLHEGHEVRVEVVGNGWRSPLISRCVKDACRVSRLGTSLDSNMCVAEGSAIFGVIAAAAEAAKAAVAATPPSEGAEAATPASPSTPATPAFDAVHSVEIVRRTGPPAPVPSADDVLAKWSETEAAFFAVDETHRLRVKALNDFETQVFRTKDAIAQACAGDANAQSALEAYIADQEKWIYDAQDGLIEDLSSATIVQRGADFDVYIYQNFPQMATHWEKEAEKQRQKDEELAKLAKEQEADKEHKSDHQRLRGAQERREQGVNLFKQEHYEEAQTRFVQALTILGNIYDNTGDNKVKRDEIALSCHLNIASCCVKLGHWKIAVNNCSKALEIKPDHPKALFRRGQANAQLSEFESAKADLEKALELSAGDSAVVAELENVKARIADAKAREKKMFSKMFS